MEPVMSESIDITNGGKPDLATQTIYAALAKHQRDDLKAMEMMLKDRIAQDLEQGYYKPGEVVDVLEAAKAQARHS